MAQTRIARRSFFMAGAALGHENRWFHDGDEVPEWAQDLITNEDVYRPLNTEEDSYVISMNEEPGEQPNPTPPAAEVDYSAMTARELRELLKERELDSRGNKTTLIERLKTHDYAVG